MILTCPACSARFVVEAASFPAAGRQVRCGVCSHAWHQLPDAPEPEAALEEIDDEEMLQEADEAAAEANAPEVAAPAACLPEADPVAEAGGERLARLEAFDEERRRSQDDRDGLDEGRKGPPLFTIAWIALVVFVVLVAGLAWFGREALVAQFPEAARLYAKLGIETTSPARVGEGLELQDVNSFKREVDGTRTLMIEGSVVNVSDMAQSVPALRAVITDAEGSQITEWTFTADSETLPPGGKASFATSTEDPERGVNLSLIFVENDT